MSATTTLLEGPAIQWPDSIGRPTPFDTLTRPEVPGALSEHLLVHAYRTKKGGRLHTNGRCRASRAFLTRRSTPLAEAAKAGTCGPCSAQGPLAGPGTTDLTRAVAFLLDVREAATTVRQQQDTFEWASTRSGSAPDTDPVAPDEAAHQPSPDSIRRALQAAGRLRSLAAQSDRIAAALPALLTASGQDVNLERTDGRVRQDTTLRALTVDEPARTVARRWAEQILREVRDAETRFDDSVLHVLATEQAALGRIRGSRPTSLSQSRLTSAESNAARLYDTARDIALDVLLALPGEPTPSEAGQTVERATTQCFQDQSPRDIDDIPDVPVPAHLAHLGTRSAAVAVWREHAAGRLAPVLRERVDTYLAERLANEPHLLFIAGLTPAATPADLDGSAPTAPLTGDLPDALAEALANRLDADAALLTPYPHRPTPGCHIFLTSRSVARYLADTYGLTQAPVLAPAPADASTLIPVPATALDPDPSRVTAALSTPWAHTIAALVADAERGPAGDHPDFAEMAAILLAAPAA